MLDFENDKKNVGLGHVCTRYVINMRYCISQHAAITWSYNGCQYQIPGTSFPFYFFGYRNCQGLKKTAIGNTLGHMSSQTSYGANVTGEMSIRSVIGNIFWCDHIDFSSAYTSESELSIVTTDFFLFIFLYRLWQRHLVKVSVWDIILYKVRNYTHEIVGFFFVCTSLLKLLSHHIIHPRNRAQIYLPSLNPVLEGFGSFPLIILHTDCPRMYLLFLDFFWHLLHFIIRL